MSITQKRRVEVELERAGWRVAVRETPTSDLWWWIDELWEIESEWSPRGARAFVTFLVDPQGPIFRRAGEHVMAVAITQHRPQNPGEASPEVYLRPRWERNVKELAAQIEALRSSRSEGAGQQGDEADKVRDG
jgi:hypothetical protein